ncbi:hypothetical protein BD769DRAFT_955890 [Suillus cothurnatus]|nr:hypothetical protein BD769DRAFT_955890 [Suillus cothurnatus]
MESRLLSVVSGSSPLKNIVQLISAVVIIFEHSFYIFDKRRYLQNQKESAPSFYAALDQYMSSSHAADVREVVSIAVQAYEAAITTTTHAYKVAVTHTSEEAVRTLPTWRAKLPFERFKKKAREASERSKEKEKEALCSQAEAELIKTILETTSNHRLPRP